LGKDLKSSNDKSDRLMQRHILYFPFFVSLPGTLGHKACVDVFIDSDFHAMDVTTTIDRNGYLFSFNGGSQHEFENTLPRKVIPILHTHVTGYRCASPFSGI